MSFKMLERFERGKPEKRRGIKRLCDKDSNHHSRSMSPLVAQSGVSLRCKSSVAIGCKADVRVCLGRLVICLIVTI
jgi:hypothetical protein